MRSEKVSHGDYYYYSLIPRVRHIRCTIIDKKYVLWSGRKDRERERGRRIECNNDCTLMS